MIFFYSKGSSYCWNPTFTPLRDEYVETFFDQRDPDGRRWKRMDLTGAGTRNGETGLSWRGIDVTAKGRHWAYPPDELDRLDAAGKVHWPKKRGGMPRLKQYPEDLAGIPLQDVWTDIRPLHNLAAERLGYPTQKPEALLERIIASSSNPKDIVLDPFCGCGTTVAVAQRMGRDWIGIDISATAIEIMKRRLWNQARLVPTIVDAPETETALKQLKPFEFQNWVINAVNGTHSPKRTGDMGIDGYWFLTRDPIQVKQSEHVGRNVVDNFETALRRAGNDGGYIIAFTFTKGAFEEVARVRSEGLNIHLVRVKEVLMQTRRAGNPLAKLGPQPEGDVLPLPPMRKPQDMPSAEELVRSDQAVS